MVEAESNDAAKHQASRTLAGLDRFPPTIVDHTVWSEENGDEPPYGIELFPMDSGTEEEPRSIFIPDNPEMETQWNL